MENLFVVFAHILTTSLFTRCHNCQGTHDWRREGACLRKSHFESTTSHHQSIPAANSQSHTPGSTLFRIFNHSSWPKVHLAAGHHHQAIDDHRIFRVVERLGEFQDYYNAHRVHQALDLNTPDEAAGKGPPALVNSENDAWNSHCNGLFQTPIAA
jgi:hypothetical protein